MPRRKTKTLKYNVCHPLSFPRLVKYMKYYNDDAFEERRRYFYQLCDKKFVKLFKFVFETLEH